jgi:hypothetical protein
VSHTHLSEPHKVELKQPTYKHIIFLTGYWNLHVPFPVLPECSLLRIPFLHILQCCHWPKEKEGMPTSLELECHISVTVNRTCCMQLSHTASLKSYRTHVNRLYDKIMLDTVNCLKYIQCIAHGIAVCCNAHNLSNWDSRITGQLCYKHTFCQKVVSTKILLVLIFS